MAPPRAVIDALAALGTERLVFAIHDASFPSAPGQDLGRGSPMSAGGRALLRFVRDLGFDAVQLGPQGRTTRHNPSPYDGALFSRSVLSVDPFALTERGWLTDDELQAEVSTQTARFADHRRAHDAVHALLEQARLRSGTPDALTRFAEENAEWLDRDIAFDLLAARHGWSWPAWPTPARELDAAAQAALLAAHPEQAARRRFEQWLAHAQHDALRAELPEGLELFGDVQIGISPRDAWAARRVLLSDYRMGAPPSRTNPAGQPWGYAVWDPAQLLDEAGAPGPGLRHFLARFDRLIGAYDGLRIDHPHGLVCPWVYRADAEDPLAAVRAGARLHAAPDLPDHPALARYALVRPEQLDRALPRHADGWVRALEPAQIARYAVLIDAVVERLRTLGRADAELVCEVLSTQPRPLAEVMARHGLGRFRVTQKANLDDPEDVYRSENAEPADWIMLGNHDTPPFWRVARQRHRTDAGRREAAYLARRLRPEGDAEPLEAALAADPHRLVHAKTAELFLSRAGRVQIFMSDLFGLTDLYNRPGVVSDENWCLRVPPDYADTYPARAARGEALNLPLALALALEGRGRASLDEHRDLHRSLLELAGGYTLGVPPP